jgi:uncharacterized protein involved in copper resistance
VKWTGLSDLDAGLRLRCEIRREFAPYIGLAYQKGFGSTADFAQWLAPRRKTYGSLQASGCGIDAY